MSQRPFDPGLQPERTVLAWQRTSLALGAGALVYARVAAQALGNWSWLLAAVGLATAAATFVWSRRRYSYTHRSLTAGTVQLADGLLPFLLAAAVAVGGVVVLLVALSTRLS